MPPETAIVTRSLGFTGVSGQRGRLRAGRVRGVGLDRVGLVAGGSRPASSGAVSTVSAVSGGTVACTESTDEASGAPEVPTSAVSRLWSAVSAGVLAAADVPCSSSPPPQQQRGTRDAGDGERDQHGEDDEAATRAAAVGVARAAASAASAARAGWSGAIVAPSSDGMPMSGVGSTGGSTIGGGAMTASRAAAEAAGGRDRRVGLGAGPPGGT